MQPHRFDFACVTNSDYTEELSFQEGGAYLDLTGHSFEMFVKASPESTTTLAHFETVAAAGDEGFYLVEPLRGTVQPRFLWETIKDMFETVYPGTFEGDGISLYHDLLVTLPSGDREAWLFGYINIHRGITRG